MSQISFRISRFFRDNSGVSAVEFGLIAPFLFILLMGSVEFGVFMNQRMKMENLARSVSEYVRMGGVVEDAMDDVIIASNLFGSDPSLSTTITMTTEEVCECDNATPVACDDVCPAGEYKRHYLDVTLEKNYTPIVNYFGYLDNIPVTGHTSLQTE